MNVSQCCLGDARIALVASAFAALSSPRSFGETRGYAARRELARTAAWFLMFHLTCFGWLIFRAPSWDKLRELTGDPSAELHGDTQHFWPYGLNYTTEVSSDEDLIRHCLIVDAMQADFGG